ncbi:MAG: ferrochelatase [Chloroflexi bacterium]|nr:ferrochelatase [Chloroflexota bacterium]
MTDCLETLDELGHEGREQFAEGGGSPELFHLAPCLNANLDFMDALADIVRRNALGWTNTKGSQPLADNVTPAPASEP